MDFLNNGDYCLCLELLEGPYHKGHIEIWACCLMPNPVHLIVVYESEEGLRRGLGVTCQNKFKT
jgi:putative transposase